MPIPLCMSVCMCACMHACMCVCVCVCASLSICHRNRTENHLNENVRWNKNHLKWKSELSFKYNYTTVCYYPPQKSCAQSILLLNYDYSQTLALIHSFSLKQFLTDSATGRSIFPLTTLYPVRYSLPIKLHRLVTVTMLMCFHDHKNKDKISLTGKTRNLSYINDSFMQAESAVPK